MRTVPAASVFLWLGSDPPLAVGPGGAVPSLSEVRALAERGAPLVALLPAESALALPLPAIPAHGEALARAVLFAAEEALAEPAERFHAAFARRPDGTIEAVLVPHGLIQESRARLAQLGLRPSSLTLDALLLPWSEGPPVAVRVGERVLVRAGQALGHAFEASLWPQLMPRLGVRELAEEWDDPESWLAACARRGGGVPLELFSGPHAVAAPMVRRRAWRAAAAAVAVLVLAIALRGSELVALRRAHAELLGEATTLYRDLSGDPGDPPDPLPMLEAAVRAAGGREGGALPLLRRVAPLLAAGGSQRLDALEYRDGSLELALRGADVAALDLLRERLGTLGGLRVELLAAQPGPGGVEGRVRIEERRR